jgi:hypothetical protein
VNSIWSLRDDARLRMATRCDRATVAAFIHDPKTIYTREGKQPLHAEYPVMPSLNVPENDAAAIADYLIGTKGQP